MQGLADGFEGAGLVAHGLRQHQALNRLQGPTRITILGQITISGDVADHRPSQKTKPSLGFSLAEIHIPISG